MPAHEELDSFLRDYKRLSRAERQRFLAALPAFVDDLKTGQFRPGLRVKRVQGTWSIFEMTWAPNGRATFEYGAEKSPGERHIIWRRCGGHDIFDQP